MDLTLYRCTGRLPHSVLFWDGLVHAASIVGARKIAVDEARQVMPGEENDLVWTIEVIHSDVAGLIAGGWTREETSDDLGYRPGARSGRRALWRRPQA